MAQAQKPDVTLSVCITLQNLLNESRNIGDSYSSYKLHYNHPLVVFPPPDLIVLENITFVGLIRAKWIPILILG